MELPESVRTSVGYDAHTVRPWNHLIVWLLDNFEEHDIDDILDLYGDEGDIDMEELLWRRDVTVEETNTARQRRFFNAIDNHADKWKACQCLQKVLRLLRLHTDQGHNLADILDAYLQELADYQQRCGVTVNELFVGRDTERTDLTQRLEDMVTGTGTQKLRGVCVSGIGGQGKSALARQVCHSLATGTSHWVVYNLDLRNKQSTCDILRCILTAVGVPTTQQHDANQLTKALKQYCTEYTDTNMLLCLDDCDAVLKDDQRAFIIFLTNMLTHVHSTTHCKVVFLLTCRQKVAVLASGLDKRLSDIPLDMLSGHEANTLLKTASQMDDIPDGICDEIVKECGYSPLAVTMMAGLLRNNTYAPDRLLFHLKLDERNVTKALRVDRCIEQCFSCLSDQLQGVLVGLSVFQSAGFDTTGAMVVLEGTLGGGVYSDVVISSLQQLHNLHLLDVQDRTAAKTQNTKKTRKEEQFSLHPLVFRYIAESKQKQFIKLYHTCMANFVQLYEAKIGKIVKLLNTNCTKGMRVLEEQKVHLLRFYDYLHDEPDKLKKYSHKTTRSRDVLVKKRVSDLSDLLLSDVKKRRLFMSEAERARAAGNDVMAVFWCVEEADVLVTLHNQADIGLEQLGRLSSGRFAGLRGLHNQPDYTALVHALFHKVKGQAKWKLGKCRDAIEHLNLSLKFYVMCRPGDAYCHLTARVMKAVGLVYIDLGEYGHAEHVLQAAYTNILASCKHRHSDDTDAATGNTPTLQVDIPVYMGNFAIIQLKRAQLCEDTYEKNQHLNKALEYLNDGMKVSRSLNLDRLDSYCCMVKTRADVYMELGLLQEALRAAEHAKNLRSAILQLPHYNVTDSTHQVAKIYMLLGDEYSRNGEDEDAQSHWICSSDYFSILESDHLVNGSIRADQPLFAQIQKDHFGVFSRLNDQPKLMQLRKFYKDVHNGIYESNVRSVRKGFMSMLYTPMELVKKIFGGGGSNFGENDAVVQCLEDDAEGQLEQMLPPGVGAGRRDSGVGTSSTEGSGSLSSTGSSLSGGIRSLRLQQSQSLEDDVFPESSAAKRQSIKKQRTLDKE